MMRRVYHDSKKAAGIAPGGLGGGIARLAADDGAEIGIEAGGFGEQRLQLIAIDAGMFDQVDRLQLVQLPELHAVGVAILELDCKAIGAAGIAGQLHAEAVAFVNEVARACHGKEAAAAELLQYGLCYVHFQGSLKQYGAAHGIKQCQAVYIGRAAVDRAHGACGADGDQLGFACQLVRVDHLENIAKDHVAQFIAPGGVLDAGFCADNRPGVIAFITQSIAPRIKRAAAASDLHMGSVMENCIDVGFHVFRSFLTTRADYSDGVNCSYKPALLNLSSGFVRLLPWLRGHGAKAPCQDIKYARSGDAVDAVREHSFVAALAASPTRSGALDRSALFLLPLTPARGDASRLAVQISAPSGLGGAVPARTNPEPFWNLQHIVITAFSCSVLGFQRLSSRHARVRTCACLRAYMCARKARTSEPNNNIYILELVIGSSAVPERFSPEPALAGMLDNGGFLRFSNKIDGRYRPKGASSGLMLGGGGESFGDFGRSVDLGEIGARICSSRSAAALAPALLGQSDGFLRVSAGRQGHVGMAMLERCAQRRRNARFLRSRPLPIGKGRRGASIAQARMAGHPPMPPFAAPPSSCTLALERGRILIGLRPDQFQAMEGCRRSGAPRNGLRQTGSGREKSAHCGPSVAGRGVNAAGKLRRFGQANGGGGHVN